MYSGFTALRKQYKYNNDVVNQCYAQDDVLYLQQLQALQRGLHRSPSSLS